MRRGLWGVYRRQLMGVGLVGVGASLAACNLIAGIHEGVLVDAGADGGRGPKREAGPGSDGGGRDGGRRDGASDAAEHDGSTDGAIHDAGSDAKKQVALMCSVVAGTTVKVDDLSRADAGGTTFGGRLFVTPNGMNDGFGIITQLPSQTGQEQIVAYEVQGLSVSSTTYPGQLVTVNTSKNRTIEVLSQYTVDGGVGTGLQLLSGVQPNALVRSGDFGVVRGGQVNSATLVDVPGSASVAYATVTNPSSGGSPYQFSFGLVDPDGGPTPALAYQQSAQFGFTSNSSLVAAGTNLYALMNQIILADAAPNALPLLTATDTLTGAKLAGLVNPPATGGTLLAAHVSASDPAKIVVIGGTLNAGGDLVACGATVPASTLAGLTLCGSGFTVGAQASASFISFGGAGGAAWNLTSDDYVSIGPNSQRTAFDLFWLGGDAHLVALTPSFLSTGVVTATAVQFDGFLNENTESNFDIAWIEQNGTPEAGALAETLHAAVVNCEPAAGD